MIENRRIKMGLAPASELTGRTTAFRIQRNGFSSTPDDEQKIRRASPRNCTQFSSNPTNAATGEAVARRQLSR